MNELLGSAAEYSKGFAALFNLQEQEGVPTCAPEIIPVSDLWARPELWALHGGSLLGCEIEVAAGGAGNTSQMAIEPGIGELVIVEDVVWSNNTGVTFTGLASLSVTPLTTSTGNMFSRDMRRNATPGGNAISGTIVRSKNDAPTSGSLTTVQRVTVPAATTLPAIPLDIVLVSPWSLRFMSAIANIALPPIHIRVRVRQATPRELSIGSL